MMLLLAILRAIFSLPTLPPGRARQRPRRPRGSGVPAADAAGVHAGVSAGGEGQAVSFVRLPLTISAHGD